MIRYTDSKFAELKTDQKFIRDYVFMLVRATISHLSKLESITVLSICKIKYVAIYKIRKKAV